MEFLRGDLPESEQLPDESGESKASKKRRTKLKKTLWGTALERVEENATKKKEAPKETPEKPSESKEAELPQPEVIETEGPELELPDVEEEPQGELIIDHSDEETVPAVETSIESVEVAPEAEPATELRPETTNEQPEDMTPPRVAPPLLFEFPPAVLGEAPAEPAAFKEEHVPATRPETPYGAPVIPSHQLHPEYQAQMFDPSSRQPEALVTEQEARGREHTARKRGVSRGVVAGGFVGWWLGNRRGKRVTAKSYDRQLKQRDERIDSLVKEREAQHLQEKRQQSIIERTQKELEAFTKRIWEQKVLRTRAAASEQVTPKIAEATQEVVAAKPERVERVPTLEVPLTPQKEVRGVRPEAKRPAVETVPVEERPVTEDLYAVPEGRRVETSAWHRIEVDNATGRAVEAPAVSYGEAFVREQQQEKLARDAAKAQAAAQVGMTLLSEPAMVPSSQPAYDPSYSVTTPSSPRSFAVVVRENLPFIKQQLRQQTTSPVTWAVAGVLVVVLLLSGVL